MSASSHHARRTALVVVRITIRRRENVNRYFQSLELWGNWNRTSFDLQDLLLCLCGHAVDLTPWTRLDAGARRALATLDIAGSMVYLARGRRRGRRRAHEQICCYPNVTITGRFPYGGLVPAPRLASPRPCPPSSADGLGGRRRQRRRTHSAAAPSATGTHDGLGVKPVPLAGPDDSHPNPTANFAGANERPLRL
jgi:hypothetical protein